MIFKNLTKIISLFIKFHGTESLLRS